MASSELDSVKGLHVHFRNPGQNVTITGMGPTTGLHFAGNPDNSGIGDGNWYDNGSPDGGLVAPSYHGLCVAAGGPGVISIPSMGASQCP